MPTKNWVSHWPMIYSYPQENISQGYPQEKHIPKKIEGFISTSMGSHGTSQLLPW